MYGTVTIYDTTEIELQHTLAAGVFSVDYSATADMRYQPERISGPPEDCYPTDSECDITAVSVFCIRDVLGKERSLPDELAVLISSKLPRDRIEELCWEEFRMSAD